MQVAAPQRTNVQGQDKPQISVCCGLFHSNVISFVSNYSNRQVLLLLLYCLYSSKHRCASFLEILKTDIIILDYCYNKKNCNLSHASNCIWKEKQKLHYHHHKLMTNAICIFGHYYILHLEVWYCSRYSNSIICWLITVLNTGGRRFSCSLKCLACPWGSPNTQFNG